MKYTIPLSYNPIDIPALTEVLTRYERVHHNQLITDFEEALKGITGAANVVALNTGTAAIHMALKVVGAGPGDVVIAPTFTYVATVNPILYLGARPVLIDSEPDTWNMDPVLLKQALEELKRQGVKPKAILVVHTYGMPCKMAEIMQLAEQYNIPVVEDAAESFGSTYNGKHAGTLGDVGIYSFNNNKVVTTYGGGALVTKRADWAQKVRFYASQSREPLPYYVHKEVGNNYVMSPLSAAAGLSQLPELKSKLDNRRRVFEAYYTGLSGYEVQFQREIAKNHSNRWFSAILFKDEATKQRVISVLGAEGIETRPLWNPMHQQPIYKHVNNYVHGASDHFFRTGLCLPSGGNLSTTDQDQIIGLIKGVL